METLALLSGGFAGLASAGIFIIIYERIKRKNP